MVVFDGVRYSLSPTLSPTRRTELAAVLDLNGATPNPPYTHLIALPASHAHNNAISNDPSLKLVTDRWVDRSVVMGKRQLEQYYSPDPAMIFSGVVACATDLSVADLEVLSAGITALGGQWRIGLTRDVTHLFSLRTGSDKYNTALHFAPQTHMCILTPHWFDDAVRLGRRIPETPYAWPDPPILRPGVILNIDDPLAAEGRRRRKPTGATEGEAGDGKNALDEGEHFRVWAGRRILLSTSLKLGGGPRGAIEARIQHAGGIIVPISEDADEDAEAKAVDECDILVTRWRSGKSYFKAARESLLIGTLSWLFSVESSGTLHSPLDSLLWYPTPKGGIPGLVDCEISITNYTGAARDYLKRLIVLIGAKFTPSMSQSNKVLVAGFQPSPKTTRALSWSIPVVNHTWLEDCIVEWRALTVGLERYIVYPPGIDFGKMLMTPHDGPPCSQSVSTLRLSGGALPGGRGIGIVNVEQEELRDAEHRTRAHEDGSILGRSMMHDILANETMADGVSMARVDVPTGSQAQAPLRARRGSIPAATMGPVTGAFVDRIVDLPADDEDVGRKRRTPANGKQPARGPPLGPRVTSRGMSKPSSVGPSGTPREVEAVVHPAGSSRDGNENRTERGGIRFDDTGKPRTRRDQEEVPQDEDTPQLVPKSKSRLVKRRSDLQTTGSKVGERIPARTSKPPRRGGKGAVIGSDSDSHSESEGSMGSVPPRITTGAGSTTPVKSGMKPRPMSRSRPASLPGRGGGDQVGVVDETGAGTGKQLEEIMKLRHDREVVTKDQEREKPRGEEKVTPRLRSPTRSPLPASVDTKNSRTSRRRLSVLVPSVPKDYFSSSSVDHVIEAESDDQERANEKNGVDSSAIPGPRHKQLAPAVSTRTLAAEASTSTSKRSKPSPANLSTTISTSISQHKAIPKSKPDASKQVTETHRGDSDTINTEGENIAPIAMKSTNPGGPRRHAANLATARLREIMPDVISFEREQKQSKRRQSMHWESVTSVEGEHEVREERDEKRRKVVRETEGAEGVEIEDVVMVSSVKTKPKPINGRGKAQGSTAASSDEDMEDPQTKNKRSESLEKKSIRGQGKKLAAIRLITTGVTLSDDVIKRLSKLGVQMTTKPTDCTHLVAKGIVRTEKFLCAMSVSPYVLTEDWADASAKGGKLLPENHYLLSDIAAEQKWAFKFADAMARAKRPEGGSSLFKQMTFYLTPKVAVDTKLLKNVVSAGGGQVQTSTTPTVRILRGKANRYVISCQEDRAIWRPLVQEGFKIYLPELVLRGALRQEIEWERAECLVAG